MKKLIKVIEKKIQGLKWAEMHERLDGNHIEAAGICWQIEELSRIKQEVMGL